MSFAVVLSGSMVTRLAHIVGLALRSPYQSNCFFRL